MRANAEDEDALTLGAFKLNRLRLLILLCLEAWSTALARLHALCKEELLLLLREEELRGAVAALDGAPSWRLWHNTNDLHLLVALLLVNLCLVLGGKSSVYNRLLLSVSLLVEVVELALHVKTSLELLLQRGDHLLDCEGRHSLDVLGDTQFRGAHEFNFTVITATDKKNFLFLSFVLFFCFVFVILCVFLLTQTARALTRQ